MEQLNIDKAKLMAEKIKKYINGNTRLEELFTVQPTMKMDVYRKTAIFYAKKVYDEHQQSGESVPHGFYAILEQEIKENNFFPTLRKRKRELEIIAETMNMSLQDIQRILLSLKPKNQFAQDTPETISARAELKELFRKFQSKFKEDFIKKIVDKKMDLLESQTTRIETKKPVYTLSIEQYIAFVLENPYLKEALQAIIYEKTGIYPNIELLKQVIRASLGENSEEELIRIFKVTKPSSYERFKENKLYRRIKNNFEPKLNKLFAAYTEEQKQEVIKYILLKVKLKKLVKSTQKNVMTNSAINQTLSLTAEPVSNNFIETISKNLKALISKGDQELLEAISSVLADFQYDYKYNLVLQKGKFYFDMNPCVTPEEYKECETYTKTECGIKKIHNEINKSYIRLNKVHTPTINQTTGPLASTEDSYQINTDIWFTTDKIKAIIDLIDKDKLDTMSDNAYKALKKFLLEDGLLWAYVADNIDINTFNKIINNFEAIYACSTKEEIKIENLDDLIKKANLYDYANDLIIGLVGLNVAAKVINYNQFSGVAVTDELIHKRLRKLVDLAVRTETITKSSLPFGCNVRLGNYQLLRYANNDPNIFTCGIDTKTCFFISVNENDFFFYSLLNKNGYVIKIVNKKGELVARASCFRKNNVFMINGIRCKNNKVNPESQEETNEMIEIVKLVKLMAHKMIELTSQDECPIDYVVCNKAGILENSTIDNEFRFEIINSDLFREPINICDDDWQEFVHTYDGQEQLLQEVPENPEKSFTTDFGNHYPALLISSRDNRALVSPRNISMDDPPAYYRRPRRGIEEYITAEITDDILARINRIRALFCFSGTIEEQQKKQAEYKLITSKQTIKSIIIGEDWFISINPNNQYDICFANNNPIAQAEARYYLARLADNLEQYEALEIEDQVYLPTFEDGVQIFKYLPKKS